MQLELISLVSLQGGFQLWLHGNPFSRFFKTPGSIVREALIWEVLGEARGSRPQAILPPRAVGLLDAKTRCSKSPPRL